MRYTIHIVRHAGAAAPNGACHLVADDGRCVRGTASAVFAGEADADLAHEQDLEPAALWPLVEEVGS
jgi:hypothetical protein